MADKFDESIPADSKKVGLGAQDIRNLTEATEDVLAIEHDVTTAGSMGFHDKVTLAILGSSTGVANKSLLHAKDLDSKAEFHVTDEDDNVVQLTSKGMFPIQNILQPSTGEVDKIILYGEDRDSKIKLRAMEEDDVVVPLEGFMTDSDATERSMNTGSLTQEGNMNVTFTGVAGEVYECIILGLFKSGTSAHNGWVTMDDANGRGDFYLVYAQGLLTIPIPGVPIGFTTSYQHVALKGYLRVVTGGEIDVFQYWESNTGTIYTDNRYMYVRRIA